MAAAEECPPVVVRAADIYGVVMLSAVNTAMRGHGPPSPRRRGGPPPPKMSVSPAAADCLSRTAFPAFLPGPPSNDLEAESILQEDRVSPHALHSTRDDAGKLSPTEELGCSRREEEGVLMLRRYDALYSSKRSRWRA
ncbi:hypothetical protein HPB50_026559 [Hyalomma asiaticum]|uniref:Uncharacterized protein n=1 Tax=Hyalomma asiaticum TaxID=266040 RepID=A0ACB7TP30_HYAAI|nr:hypothetical protein HPB50_026559 [Hyalomma asiaticum]